MAGEKVNQNTIIYGKHLILETLRETKTITQVYLQKNIDKSTQKDIIKLVRQDNIPLEWKSKQELDDLSNHANHQGLLALVSPYQYSSIEEIINLAKSRAEAPFILILDSIQDPHNLGSIIRTADAVGVHGVIIPKKRAVEVTPTVAKVSAGAINRMLVAQVTNLASTVDHLKKEGIWVFATDMNGENMWSWNTTGPIALIIGNEGRGVSRLLKNKADGIVTIPMTGQVQSLNASVAAAVLMYEVARDRLTMH